MRSSGTDGYAPFDRHGPDLVDDDEQSLRAVRALLAAFGFKGLCASSGADAMLLLEKHGGEIDCVLTDLYMPGVSGMDLLMHVRQANPELPVVVVTGNADVPSAVTCDSRGCFRLSAQAAQLGDADAGAGSRYRAPTLEGSQSVLGTALGGVAAL